MRQTYNHRYFPNEHDAKWWIRKLVRQHNHFQGETSWSSYKWLTLQQFAKRYFFCDRVSSSWLVTSNWIRKFVTSLIMHIIAIIYPLFHNFSSTEKAREKTRFTCTIDVWRRVCTTCNVFGNSKKRNIGTIRTWFDNLRAKFHTVIDASTDQKRKDSE